MTEATHLLPLQNPNLFLFQMTKNGAKNEEKEGRRKLRQTHPPAGEGNRMLLGGGGGCCCCIRIAIMMSSVKRWRTRCVFFSPFSPKNQHHPNRQPLSPKTEGLKNMPSPLFPCALFALGKFLPPRP